MLAYCSSFLQFISLLLQLVFCGTETTNVHYLPMAKIPSKFSSMTACKCPRCRTGHMFRYPTYDIIHFSKAYDNCPHCHLKYEHETGFFWGAMYISYSFSSGLMIVFGVLAINNDWTFMNILITIIGMALLFTPFFFRYARVIMMYGISPNRKFDPKYL